MSATHPTHDVIAWKLHDQARADFLPLVFGSNFLRGEALTFAWAMKLSRDYGGGMWDFYQLSNGGGYLAPKSEEPFRVEIDSNGYEGSMSASAFGIVVTLFALGHLAEITQSALVSERYHALRDFAYGHPEAREIFRAID